MATMVSMELGLVQIWPTVGRDFEHVAQQRPCTRRDFSSKLNSGVARVKIYVAVPIYMSVV